ncbi:response regulator [Caulobacter sp. KR2-114]|uniref:response regulator n=1 Tax=Caulobacter sp. KR2-114 TaxID=3400912 RepID=UPI003BFBA617
MKHVRSIAVAAPKVLIADDHPAHRLMAAAQFEALGFDVQLAADGLEAALAAYHQRFEIVLMDRHMPRWDGDHAAQVIRDPASASRQAIVVCHSSAPPANCTGTAFDVIVPKPLSPGSLQSLVERRIAACVELSRRGLAPCETCSFDALTPPSVRALRPRVGPRRPDRAFPRPFDALRTRDLEVVCCLACGDDTGRIARFLGASPGAVRDALRRAVRQLELDSVASLRRLAEGLLAPGRPIVSQAKAVR